MEPFGSDEETSGSDTGNDSSNGGTSVCQLNDKLKAIRPFSESQLMDLYSNEELQRNGEFTDTFLREALEVENKCSFFDSLNQFKKWRQLLTKSKETIAKLRTRSDKLQEEIWRLETRTLIKKARCADSRVVEATHVFNEAVFDQSKLVILRQNLLNIQKALVDEHCYNLYQTKLTQKQIENEIDTIVRQIATRTRSADLRQLISALFYFQRISDPFPDDEFDRLVRQWLSLLVNCLYSFPMHENALFLLNHVLRCPSGVNEFLASFVQCQSPLRLLDHQQAIEQVNYCLTFLSTILSPVKLRERFVRPSKIRYVTDATSSQLEKESSDDDLWHLLDGENEKGEDIALNSSDLTEIDIIQLLKQIPFEDVLQFLTSGLPEISNGEDDDCEEEEEEEEGFRFGEYSEIAMLKLLAISTQIIQILRQGLLSFNCMKFKSLSDHITILIKKTILSVCGFWQQCKAKLHSQDQALILRIQVEYDHFILRSVVTILSSQKYGVWKFISVIPFEGITESMMWHILWVFYNGRDEIDELGGLCPYFSDAYWKAKFNEPGTKALFREKLPNLSQSELECLLRSLGNMIKSRKVKEIDFIRTIVEEMFEISCYKPLCSSSLVYRYIQITSELAYLHPFIISIILNGIDSKNEVNEHCIELVIKLPVHLWFPSTETILTLRKWICSNDLTHQLNQLSRIVLSRLNYGSVGGRLNLDVQKHRTIATVVYEALAKHLSVHETLEFSCSFADCTAAFLIKIAKTHSLKMFMEWSWRILLFLKLSPADQPVEPSADFYPLPNLHSDCELLEVSKGFENRNLYSIYICLSMTDIGQNQSLLDFNLEMISHLLLNRIYVPALQLLSWFIPFHLKNSEMILSNVKLQTVLNQMISLEDDTIGHRLLGIIRLQFNRHLDQQEQLLNFWTFLLCEQASIILRQASNAWFIGQLKGLRQIVSLLNNIAIFTFRNEKLFNQLVELLSVKSSEMQSLKLPASGMLGNLLTIAAAPKKCDWITPMHYLYERCSDQTWFAYLLIKSDYLKIEKLWDEIQIELSLHSEYKIDKVTKTVCANYNVTMLPFPLLPVNAWMQLVLETPDEHPLMPLIWYNFFSYFFASPGPGGSLGLRCVIPELLKKGKAKLATMIDHYHRLWSSHISNPMHSDGKENDYIESLLKLYRAYALWIDDTHLHDAYVDVEHLEARYMSEHFKQVLIGNEAPFRAYLDYRLMDQQLQTADKSWQEVIALHQAPFAVQEDDHVAHNSSFLSKFKRLELSCEPVLSAVNNVTSNSSNSSGAKNNGDEDLIESVDFVADLVMPILKNYIRCIIEETDTFDKKLEQLTQLNCQLLADFELLYKNVPNKVTKKVPCDKDGYDPDGCTGPANIQFEFQENVKICNNFKLIEQNRMNYNYIMNEILDIPSSKLISYSIYLERHVPCLPDRLDQSQQLLQYFLSFIDESNVLSFPPASNIFNLLIESLSADDQQNDRNNIFLLHTALTYPKMIEHLTTRLSPSTCSAAYFIQMYQMIQEHLYQTPPHVLFVLLSKFDMNARLRICSESDCLVFLNTLSNAFHGLGQKPDEDKLILIGLYRKHLQYFVIHRFPDYLISVMEMMLKGMSSSTIYPPLWNDLLLSFGLYLPAKAISTKEIIIEFKKYSLNQPLFTSSEIYDIMRLFHQHFQAQLTTRPNQDLLDFYKEYIRSFFPILCALSFIWINTNSADKSNFDNIWNSCVNVWDLWLFPTSSISLLDVPDFEYVWSLFTSVVEHFVEQFGSLSGRILAYMLSSVADHFSRITVHHAQILAVIEEQLYSLPWQLFSPDCNALHCMVAICQSDKYSFNKLISKMLYTVRWNNWDCSVLAEELSSSMELLARILIRVPVDPLKINVKNIPFNAITSEKAPIICHQIRRQINLEEFLSNQNELCKLYFELLERICDVRADPIQARDQHAADEQHAKKKLYSLVFCEIISHAIIENPAIYRKHTSALKMFFADFLYEINVFSFETSETNRIEIFDTLLPIINGMASEEARNINLKILLKNASVEKAFTLNLFASCCRNLTNQTDYVNACENSIINLATTRGKIEEMLQCFTVPAAIEYELVDSCIALNSYLTLYLYFLKKKQTPDDLNDLLNNFTEYFIQMKPIPNLEAKYFAIWFNLTIELDNVLQTQDQAQLIQRIIKISRAFILTSDEAISPRFLSFIKSSKKNISFRSAFLCLVHAAVLVSKVFQVIADDHALFYEVVTLLKLVSGKLQAIKKNKNFAELSMLIEKIINLIDSEIDVKEHGIPILKSWLLAYYSDSNYFELLLNEYAE